MAAPGSPNACVMPSRRRISTAARAAVIRGMAKGLSKCGSEMREPAGRSASAAGEALDAAQQCGVVKSAVADGLGGGHQLAEHGTNRNDDAGLPRCRGDDAEILVVQLDPEAGIEGAVEHLLPLLVQ